ncbi:MAG: YHS domain-containing protein, partial [Sphingobium sp.]|nr:YHS domain-containing protein [Sphingobium sp.]
MAQPHQHEHHDHHGHDHQHQADTQADGRARDPVCGMMVDQHATAHHAEHAGKTFYFCSAKCREKFVADPALFLGDTPPAPVNAPEGTIWTCPMHPEIRQDHPGACPICGMALEPALVTANSGPSPELRDMTWRFWIGLVLSVPVFGLEMGGHIFPALHHLIPMSASIWAQMILATPVVLWAGWPFFERGWASLVNRSLNMFTLIAMGV